MGDGMAAAGARDLDLLAIAGGAGKRQVDGAPRPVGGAPDERQIGALKRSRAAMIGELGGEPLVGPVGLGDHHQARCVLVQPVDDARTGHAADAGEARPAMGDERIDQRAAGVAGGGMDDQPGGLVDDDEVVVLVNDGQRDIFGGRFGGHRRRQVDG